MSRAILLGGLLLASLAPGCGPVPPFHDRSTESALPDDEGGQPPVVRVEDVLFTGLKWIGEHQSSDGHWSLEDFAKAGRCQCMGAGQANNIAGTAYALLSILGVGITHKTSADENKPYPKVVQRGLTYLVLKQNRDGDFGGGMHAQGWATYAVCEAYGLTSDPSLKGPAQRALTFLIKAQGEDGGWSPGPDKQSDIFIFVTQVQALKSGQMAGLNVPRTVFLKATRFLDTVGTADGSRYGVTSRDDVAQDSTAAGLLCRQYLGWGPRHPGLIQGVEHLVQAPPAVALKNMRYYYLASQVLFNMGGKAREDWQPKMRALLHQSQDKGATVAHQKGSWSAAGDKSATEGGRLMTTALALLILDQIATAPLPSRD